MWIQCWLTNWQQQILYNLLPLKRFICSNLRREASKWTPLLLKFLNLFLNILLNVALASENATYYSIHSPVFFFPDDQTCKNNNNIYTSTNVLRIMWKTNWEKKIQKNWRWQLFSELQQRAHRSFDRSLNPSVGPPTL